MSQCLSYARGAHEGVLRPIASTKLYEILLRTGLACHVTQINNTFVSQTMSKTNNVYEEEKQIMYQTNNNVNASEDTHHALRSTSLS